MNFGQAIGYSFLTKSAKIKHREPLAIDRPCYSFLTKSAKIKLWLVVFVTV